MHTLGVGRSPCWQPSRRESSGSSTTATWTRRPLPTRPGRLPKLGAHRSPCWWPSKESALVRQSPRCDSAGHLQCVVVAVAPAHTGDPRDHHTSPLERHHALAKRTRLPDHRSQNPAARHLVGRASTAQRRALGPALSHAGDAGSRITLGRSGPSPSPSPSPSAAALPS